MNRSAAAGGTATLVASALSNQLGAATGSLAFPVMGPVGVVAVRQLVAAAVLLPAVRPKLRELNWQQWWPVLLLALSFGTMNLGLYASIQRIGLGLAVTLEFLGPLAVALVSSRQKAGAVCAIAAAAGVVLIARPEASTDLVGIGFGLMAACSWAAYILLNRVVGRRIQGIQGTAAASGVSATVFLPVRRGRGCPGLGPAVRCGPDRPAAGSGQPVRHPDEHQSRLRRGHWCPAAGAGVGVGAVGGDWPDRCCQRGPEAISGF